MTNLLLDGLTALLVVVYVITVYYALKFTKLTGKVPRGWWLLIIGLFILLARRVAFLFTALFFPSSEQYYMLLDDTILPLVFAVFLVVAIADLYGTFEKRLKELRSLESSTARRGQ